MSDPAPISVVDDVVVNPSLVAYGPVLVPVGDAAVSPVIAALDVSSAVSVAEPLATSPSPGLQPTSVTWQAIANAWIYLRVISELSLEMFRSLPFGGDESGRYQGEKTASHVSFLP